MAAYLKLKHDIDVDLLRGSAGEFTVWVGDACVIEKKHQIFPTTEECAAAVLKAIPSALP